MKLVHFLIKHKSTGRIKIGWTYGSNPNLVVGETMPINSFSRGDCSVAECSNWTVLGLLKNGTDAHQLYELLRSLDSLSVGNNGLIHALYDFVEECVNVSQQKEIK